MARFFFILFSILLIAGAGLFFSRELALASKPKVPIEESRPPFFLPELRYVKLVSFGFPTILARTLWFSTINYFGKQMGARKDVRWLSHMCELTTSLDSGPRDPLEFCSTMLAWVIKDPVKADRILTLGIKRHPTYWRFYYLRGFNRWYFLEDMDAAQKDLLEATKQPDCLPFVHGLASRMMTKNGSTAVAKAYLSEMVEKTTDEAARSVFQEKLSQAVLTEYFDLLNEGISRFEKKMGVKPKVIEDLVNERILRTIPKDPFGGDFLLNVETGEVYTTSGKKPLLFAGKTAKTGIMADEFKNWSIGPADVTP